MTLYRVATLLSLCVSVLACGNSHEIGDEPDCRGPTPTDCWTFDDSRFCCDPAPARCEDGEWVCNSLPSGWSCEGSCSGDSCRGVVGPTCYRELSVGCCSAEDTTFSFCMGFGWVCPEGYTYEDWCSGGFEPDCVRCADANEVECMDLDYCVPVYDDSCCSSCTPGPCADCVDIEFVECAVRRHACSDGPACGTFVSGLCEGEPPTCIDAVPVGEGHHCSIPGCIKARPAGCLDEACEYCKPIRAQMCGAATCEVPPPECGEWAPETDGSCYTFDCIPTEYCAPTE